VFAKGDKSIFPIAICMLVIKEHAIKRKIFTLKNSLRNMVMINISQRNFSKSSSWSKKLALKATFYAKMKQELPPHYCCRPSHQTVILQALPFYFYLLAEIQRKMHERFMAFHVTTQG
jgi:hypothetical protein